MDIITDLSSQAVSYLTVIQDICRSKKAAEYLKTPTDAALWEVFDALSPEQKLACAASYNTRINEIIWSGSGIKDEDAGVSVFLSDAKQLLAWLKNLRLGLLEDGNVPGLWVTPDYWRVHIKRILYEMPETRFDLVVALHYIPVQLIHALAKKPPTTVFEQRLYQFYITKKEVSDAAVKPVSLLTSSDVEKIGKFWQQPILPQSVKELIDTAISQKDAGTVEKWQSRGLTEQLEIAAILLLEDNTLLLSVLDLKAITVPFVSLFEKELKEIEKLRANRAIELNTFDESKFPLPVKNTNSNYDPEKKADEMHLAGLAFSGGGIRSATFNLGILQKLAELGTLPRFDYLSTVSGGGYIGAWYTSWIYHDKSIKKVVDRLNGKKSTDPLAEEVRPIRWLRMYSNYLSPNASIMSADSWTVGITWLRNTMINQVILLLILLTLLASINALFEIWGTLLDGMRVNFSGKVLLWSSVIMGVGAFLAGSGMRNYDRKNPPANLFIIGKYNKLLSLLLVIWVVVLSIVIAFLFLSEEAHHSYVNEHYTYKERIGLLKYSVIPSFLGMLAVAFIGGYHRRNEKEQQKPKYIFKLRSTIFIASAIASVAGLVLLSLAWQFMQTFDIQVESDKELMFVFGMPIIIESICITIIVRMVIMGKFFPDERREWWGRMGAMVHRFLFWWIIISFSVLCLPDYFNEMGDYFLAYAGGWAGIVGIAVKMAYSSMEPAEKPEGGVQQKAKDLFIRIAPYLFMAGFLLIGVYVLDRIEKSVPEGIYNDCLPIILGALTLLLSWRAGVNEFSLHDFYRNRLVRAYMGGTRRRTERDKTANGFTGFDKDDDITLASVTSKDYSGPYPLINTALNATTVSELDRQDRMAESFVFTPLYCGFDFSGTMSSSLIKNNVFNFGYRPTGQYSRESGPLLGTAMAISGAAVSPNMGYHSSSAISFLLTIFNVRLGRWIGNPRRKGSWQNSDPGLGLGYLLSDLIGKSDIDANYVYLSDGGHFDNMGLYELIRRRCTYIVLGDGEQDENAVCEGLANAIRRCRIDFGVEIDLDVTAVAERDNAQLSASHIINGRIKYPNNDREGTIIYIKTAMTNMKQTDVREYFLLNPKFPQQSTSDQFFDEAQFESYRKLGYDSIANAAELLPNELRTKIA